MKHGKAPSVNQRKLIQKEGLEPEPKTPEEKGKPCIWLVTKDTPDQMEVVHRRTLS